MRKRPLGILIISILDLFFGFYFGVNTLQWQASRNSWKEIITYDWPLVIFCLVIISLPLIWISILTLRLKSLGRRLNIIFFSGIILLYLTYLLRVHFLNGTPLFLLVKILISIAIIFYLTRNKIKELFK